ncbi:MAG: hypothetical protein H7Y32_16635 [Chloroflexales bacterium]|nr:hypothetical protein [Chloroflexales bacterium]
MRTILAVTHHDTDGRMFDQMQRVLLRLAAQYDGIAVRATPQSAPGGLALLHASGAAVALELPGAREGLMSVGQARREVVKQALEMSAELIHLCDFDRALHWAEFYPDELAGVIAQLGSHDFTVLGRTQRAFETHPQVQRDTERIINALFAAAYGQPWDVTAASRGLTRAAAEWLTQHSDDDTIGNDCSWPLLLRRTPMRAGHLATEGLEFETADRFADAIAAAGGRAQWIAQIDADPRAWAMRLELARIEAESIARANDEQM